MKRIFGRKTRFVFFLRGVMLFICCCGGGGGVFAQPRNLFLGVKLRPEVQNLVEEIERKTGRRIYAEFAEFGAGESTLGVSYMSEGGTPIVRVNIEFNNLPRMVEPIVAHELLHLKLRADGYPVFLFSPTVKTRRGLAQDVEQSNVNDLASMIEHRIFKADMERFGLSKMIDLAGDTERSAVKRKGEADGGQADSINFARAVLEYQNPADVTNLRRIYQANKWHKSLQTGQEIADLIQKSRLDSPQAAAAAFRLCAAKLYPSPRSRPLKLMPDKSITAYKQLLIGF